MTTAVSALPPGDPKLVQEIVDKLKSQGLFDQFRKEGMGDVDTKVKKQTKRHYNKSNHRCCFTQQRILF